MEILEPNETIDALVEIIVFDFWWWKLDFTL